MEKRVFLAIFLSLRRARGVPGVLRAAADAARHRPQANAPRAARRPRSGRRRAPARELRRPRLAPTAGARSSPTPPARDIVVETDTVSAVFTTKGAALKSWKLKKYFDEQHQPLELVPQDLPDTLPRPLPLATDDAALSADACASALYHAEPRSALTLGSSPGTLSFEYRTPSGLTAHKTFEFQPDGKAYVVKVDASIDVGGKSQPVAARMGTGASGLG